MVPNYLLETSLQPTTSANSQTKEVWTVNMATGRRRLRFSGASSSPARAETSESGVSGSRTLAAFFCFGFRASICDFDDGETKKFGS